MRKSVRTNGSSSNIVALSDIRQAKRNAYSPFGPVSQGLTTSQITNEVQLTELLNSLENTVASLNSKSYEVLDTLVKGIEAARVALLPSTPDTTGTE